MDSSRATKHKLSSLLLGLEPTGHYWFNLANWLLKHGMEVVLVNPVTTHRNKENRDNSPSKNDAKDATTIADAVCRGYYTEYTPQAPQFDRLKTLMSNREFWVKQSTSLGNRIVRWIDLYFPEFRRAFPDWTVKRSLASLRAFPLPSDLANHTADDVITGWRNNNMKRAGGSSGRQKAAKLLAAAKHSIGDTRTPDEARRDLLRLLDAYADVKEEMEIMQKEVEDLLEQIPMVEQLRSIRGLGATTIAVILGCAGDLRHYSHGRQLLRRAGLNLAERKSGKYTGQIKLSKRGDSTLRKHLYLAMLTLIRLNSDFKKWHDNNLKRGMKKLASLIKLIGKLARIVVGMVQRGEPYRLEQQAPAAA